MPFSNSKLPVYNWLWSWISSQSNGHIHQELLGCQPKNWINSTIFSFLSGEKNALLSSCHWKHSLAQMISNSEVDKGKINHIVYRKKLTYQTFYWSKLLWRWLPLRLLKHHSPTTIIFRATALTPKNHCTNYIVVHRWSYLIIDNKKNWNLFIRTNKIFNQLLLLTLQM